MSTDPMASPGPLTDDEIEAIVEAEAGASDGPWQTGASWAGEGIAVLGPEGQPIAVCGVGNSAADEAAFIATVRNALPRLLADRQRQADELARPAVQRLLAHMRGEHQDGHADEACQACMTIQLSDEADQARAELEAASGTWHSVWLHGKWRWLTQKMTTEEREHAATAVERHWDVMRADDGEDMSRETRDALRWWTCSRCRHAPREDGYTVCSPCAHWTIKPPEWRPPSARR